MRRDMDNIRDLFAEFRVLGYWARTNQPDGWKAVPEDVLKRQGKVVFWHANNTAFAFDGHGNLRRPLHLQHFVRDAAEVQRLAAQYALDAVAEVTLGNTTVVLLPKATNTSADPFTPAALVRRTFTYHGPLPQVEFTVDEVDAEGGLLRCVSEAIPGGHCTLPASVLRDALFAGLISETTP